MRYFVLIIGCLARRFLNHITHNMHCCIFTLLFAYVRRRDHSDEGVNIAYSFSYILRMGFDEGRCHQKGGIVLENL